MSKIFDLLEEKYPLERKLRKIKSDLAKEGYLFDKVFGGKWEGINNLTCNFDITRQSIKGIEFIFAYCYASDEYSETAFILYREARTNDRKEINDRRLFEVNANHCSCMGFEGQWKPEQTTIVAIKDRIVRGDLGWDETWRDDRTRWYDGFASILKKKLTDSDLTDPQETCHVW